MSNFWRPFTQEAIASDRIKIKSAKGIYLYDENGKKYIDCISSWWTINHGHCHPKIVKAIQEQAQQLDHVIAADLSNNSSELLIEGLKKFLDKSLCKFFFSDNGSTAVEVAMKIAYQYWINKEQKKQYFITFQGGYHGDTLGAMSLGKSSNFFTPFNDMMYQNILSIDFPETWESDEKRDEKEKRSIVQFEQIIDQYQGNIACFILEPLIQGASGMRFCSINFLNKICKIAKENDILLIFDEVMTGFGRTGKMFAYQHLDHVPDIIALSKGITGGMLPLGLTIATGAIYEAFYSDKISKAFLHGHSYTANPIVCAAANAAIGLFTDDTFKKIAQIENWYKRYIVDLTNIEKIRIMGNICAFDVKNVDTKYGSNFSKEFKKKSFKAGFIIRPLGNTVYLIPPFCIKEEDVKSVFSFF